MLIRQPHLLIQGRSIGVFGHGYPAQNLTAFKIPHAAGSHVDQLPLDPLGQGRSDLGVRAAADNPLLRGQHPQLGVERETDQGVELLYLGLDAITLQDFGYVGGGPLRLGSSGEAMGHLIG